MKLPQTPSKWVTDQFVRLWAGYVLLASASSALAGETNGAVRLTGIISYSTNTFALLEDPAQGSREILLGEGQSNGRLSVIRIEPAAGKVEIHNAGVFTNITFARSEGTAPAPDSSAAPPAKPAAFLELRQAGGSVLYLYQLLTGRTMIPSPALPPFRVDAQVKAGKDQAELAAAIENALAAKGVLIQQERDKFAAVITPGERTKLTPELWDVAVKAHHRPTPGHSGGDAEPGQAANDNAIVPPGFINFIGADLDQVLMIYQELAGRTLLRPAPASGASSVWLRTATSLTYTEALFALHLVFALNDLSVLPVGDKFLLLFPAADAGKASKLLARPAATPSVSNTNLLPALSVQLRGTGLKEVADLYQRLSGQPVRIDGDFPGVRFVLTNKTPLTSTEALSALDLLLAWHGLAITPQPDFKGLTLSRSATGQ
jgi:hypothetical protein